MVICTKERSLGTWEHFKDLERTLVLNNAKTLSPKSVKPETLEEIRRANEGRKMAMVMDIWVVGLIVSGVGMRRARMAKKS